MGSNIVNYVSWLWLPNLVRRSLMTMMTFIENAYILGIVCPIFMIFGEWVGRRAKSVLAPFWVQGLRASSLQFTSPLEFNAIFCDRITLRLELSGWSKIRDPVPAKFKHVTNIVTCTLLCCDWITYMLALWNFQKADFEPYSYGKKYTTFSFSHTWGARFKYLPEGCPYMLMYSALHIMQWFSHILDVFTPKIRQIFFDFNIFVNQNKRR